MKKTAVRMSALVLAMASLMPFAASCKKQTPSDVIDANYEWVKNTSITDSSQIASYSGQNKMSLNAWQIASSTTRYESSQDVVTPEIERITGVKIGRRKDNGGLAADEAFLNLTASDNVHIAYGRGWVDPEAVWDLTDLIKEYCPTIMERMPESVWSDTQITAGQKGKVYGIPYGLGNMGLSDLDPLATAENSPLFQFLNEPYPYIVVREDVLKEAYPEAKTQAQIDAMFAEKGGFTEEDLFDVEITSAAQFRTEFLPKIQNVLNTNPRYTSKNGRKVQAMMASAGSDYDTWDFLGTLIPKLLGGAGTHTNTQFTYWDSETQKIELMMTQDWYLDEVEEWNKLVQEGKYVTKTDFDSSHQTLSNSLNSGFYAIGYQSSTMPSNNEATYTLPDGTTEKVKYRKVYLKIPLRENLEFFASGTPAVSSVMFFKDTVRESDLPQLLRWLDFQCSRVADKLYAWGPATEELFNEAADGKRTFKNEELAQQMVYSTGRIGTLVQKYNLANGSTETVQPTFPFVYGNASIYHPKSSGQYDLSSLEGMANTFFSSAIVCSDIKPVGLAKFPSLHTWTETDLPGITDIWGKRNLLETDLKKLLTSSNFDGAVASLKSTLNTAGWTDAYFNGTYTQKFLALNEAFLDQFYEG